MRLSSPLFPYVDQLIDIKFLNKSFCCYFEESVLFWQWVHINQLIGEHKTLKVQKHNIWILNRQQIFRMFKQESKLASN